MVVGLPLLVDFSGSFVVEVLLVPERPPLLNIDSIWMFPAAVEAVFISCGAKVDPTEMKWSGAAGLVLVHGDAVQSVSNVATDILYVAPLPNWLPVPWLILVA